MISSHEDCIVSKTLGKTFAANVVDSKEKTEWRWRLLEGVTNTKSQLQKAVDNEVDSDQGTY